MADPPGSPESGDDTGLAAGRESSTPTPRWAKVVGIIVGVLVLLFAIKMLFFGGGFGLVHTPPAGVH